MLVPFVVDSDSLAPDPSWTTAQTLNYNQSLLDIWLKIGLLAYDGGDFDRSKLYQAILDMPQNIRSRWKAMLEVAPKFSCADWSGTVEPANLGSFCDVANLAIVDDARAELDFNLTDDTLESSVRINDSKPVVDICRFISSDKARQFKDALMEAENHIESGTTYQDIWNMRFKNLALSDIKRISIVDRYSIANQLLCDQHKLSGLERFLRLLDEDSSGKRYVTCYSALTKEIRSRDFSDIQKNLQSLLMRLPKKNIKEMKIIMLSDYDFGNISHDRFVRFDRYVWDLGLGVDVFEGAYSVRRSSANLKTWPSDKSYKVVEEDLSNHSKKSLVISSYHS